MAKTLPASAEVIDRSVRDLYVIDKRLGKGAYGIVWQATEKKTGRIVALKKIFDAFRNVTDAQRTFREIIYLQEFGGHDNIITLLDVIKADNDKDIYLIFEHMDADLHMVCQGKLLEPVHVAYIMCQSFKALHYMHSGGVVHRDLKPSNVLIDDSCHARLADFGLARSISSIPEVTSEVDPTMTDYVATRWYRSPEILLGSTAYTLGTDVWSMGCILGEMLGGCPVFQGSSSMHQLDLITKLVGRPSKADVAAMKAPYAGTTFQELGKGVPKSWAETFPKADPMALDLLRKLLVMNPTKRMTAAEALAHPYLAQFMTSEGGSAPELLLSMAKEVKTPFDDNQRLDIKDYRSRLYDMVRSNRFSAPRPIPFRPPPLSAGSSAKSKSARGEGLRGAPAEDAEIEALKALSVRDVTPRNSQRSQRTAAKPAAGPLGSRSQFENSPANVHVTPAAQKVAWGAEPPSSPNMSISQRVRGMHKEVVQDHRLMDIYGTPVRARTPGSAAGFNKRNASSIFGGSTDRVETASSRTAHGRPTSSWRPQATADMQAPRAGPTEYKPRQRTQTSNLPFSSARAGGSARGSSRTDGGSYPW